MNASRLQPHALPSCLFLPMALTFTVNIFVHKETP